MPGKNTPEKGSSSVIVSLNPDGIVTAKPYHDDIVVDLNPKTKLVSFLVCENWPLDVHPIDQAKRD